MNDPKFSWVARKANCNVATVVAVWAALLEHASQADPRGSVETFDCEAYDCALGLDDGVCAKVTGAMREKGLIASESLAKWDERQPKRERDDDSSERVRKHRENKRNATVTPCNALEEIREDKKKEEQTEGAKAPRATKRCPPEFQPDRDYALREIPGLDVDREIQKFRDWEFKTARKDWPAVWRTWIGNCRDRGQYAKKSNGHDPYKGAL